MKVSLLPVIALAVSVALSARVHAQAPKHDMMAMEKEHATATATGWKELDAFHTLLAGTWHPVEKSKDFKPIRMQAADLADAAQALNAAKAPKQCDGKSVRDARAAISLGTRTLANQVVRKASDADVRKALQTIHTRFEGVEMKCRPAKK